MEAVVCQFPHILKWIYMPAEYAAIVLSGIVTSSNDEPITTELPVGFEIHLPNLTKDESKTSLLIAAGPDVAVNLIIGLPFIKATGMIGDFADNICQAKNLLCSLFPINFKHAMKSIPVFTGAPASCNKQTQLLVLLPIRKHDFPIVGLLPCHLTPLHLRMSMIISIRSWGTLGICKCHLRL